MFSSIIMVFIFWLKSKLTLNLFIVRRDADKDSSIFDVIDPTQLYTELIFCAVHPSPFLVGCKIWWYSIILESNYYYNVNDYIYMLMAIKLWYI